MANILYYPKANPIRFFLPDPSTQYHTRHIEDFEFFNTIPEWKEHINYYQPWEKLDLIKLQLQADFGPHNVNILDQDDIVVNTVTFQQLLQNEDNPDLYIYQLDIDISALPAGAYRLQLVSGMDSPLTLISNQISVCETHKHTILLSYRNSLYHEGLVFDSPYYPSYRVEGAIVFLSPASRDQSYEDQSLDESLLSSVPFNTYNLIIGDARGVPDYVIDIVNRILSCDDITIDGRTYTKNEGAKWEFNEQDGFPQRGWKIEMRETSNRPARVFDSNQPVNAKIGIVINADSKGFGLDTGGTTYEITDVQ